MLMSACQHSSLKYRVSVDVFKNCVVYLAFIVLFSVLFIQVAEDNPIFNQVSEQV